MQRQLGTITRRAGLIELRRSGGRDLALRVDGALEVVASQEAAVSPYGRRQQDRTNGSSHPTVRVVVVDDHSVVRHGVISWLRVQAGYEVVAEAETAKIAIAQAILHKPDIVLLDVGLPEEGGLCAAHKIVRTCSQTKVVAFSASADPVHVRGMLAAGAKGYVLKASEPSIILSAIRAVTDGSRFLDPGLSDAVIEELDLFPNNSRSRQVLTPRETQVLECIVWGYTNREMAAELGVNVASVNSFRIRLCEKLNLTSRNEIVRYGVAIGLVNMTKPAKRPASSVSELCVPLTRNIQAVPKC